MHTVLGKQSGRACEASDLGVEGSRFEASGTRVWGLVGRPFCKGGFKFCMVYWLRFQGLALTQFRD